MRRPDLVFSASLRHRDGVATIHEMEVYRERPRRRTLLLIRNTKNERLRVVETPDLAVCVFYYGEERRLRRDRSLCFLGVVPYRIEKPPRGRLTPTRTPVILWNTGNSGWFSTCLGVTAISRVKSGVLDPVEAYWNTAFSRSGLTGVDSPVRVRAASDGPRTLRRVFDLLIGHGYGYDFTTTVRRPSRS